MAPSRLLKAAVVLSVCITVASCGSAKPKDGPPRGGVASAPGDAVPRPEPRSRYGNGPVYEVFGKQYTVMDSSYGYRERGVASWYGKKFHGNLTSNRETYDMYAMTAAHKTLPLPTYVKVRNLRNNKSIVVRVNDRGPFVHNRIIDLSYTAALKLDMVKDGTSLVEVTAISFDDPPAQDVPVRQTAVPAPKPAQTNEPVALQPRPTANPAQRLEPSTQPVANPELSTEPVSKPGLSTKPVVEGGENTVFAQVGAFGSRENADRRLQVIKTAGIANSFIHEDRGGDGLLYRVRIGPIREVIQYDILVEELENLGIMDPYLVTE